MKYLLPLAVMLVLITACANDSKDGWSDLDLVQYNVPITIEAPDSAEVVSRNLSGLIDDVTIKSPENRYSVQILASEASTNDMARLKAEQLELVRDNRYFEQVVEEESNGFIFENRIDTTALYGFRYIVYRGDREYVFQNSFDGIFTLEEVRVMYESVKPKN